MKWNRKNLVANDGVIFVKSVINEHGSIFREVHQENDIGIDGFLEYVENENSTGQLLAVQIKSGDSYLNSTKKKFVLYVDAEHLDYWDNFVVPVVLIFYSPTLNKASFLEIRQFIEREKYYNRLPITKIEVGLDKESNFNAEAIKKRFKKIIELHKDEKILLDCIDKCLSNDIHQQKEGFLILSNHPSSENKKIITNLARNLLMSKDEILAKNAIKYLGYKAGGERWSWNPNNEDEKKFIWYSRDICSSLNEEELKRIILLTQGEYWNGPDGLGERVIDILACCDGSISVVNEILYDEKYPIEIRGFCLYYLYEADESSIIEDKKNIIKNKSLKKVYNWLFEENE